MSDLQNQFEGINTSVVDELIKRVDELKEQYEKDVKLILESLATVTKGITQCNKDLIGFRDKWSIQNRAAKF